MMHLAYYTTHVANFGDDLNRDIWPALAPGLFARDDPDHAFVGIGTILGMPRVKSARVDVFSTGAGNDPIGNWAGQEVRFHCVRGPVTAQLCGLAADCAVSDGALLTPLVPGFPQRGRGGGGTVVVPHFETAAHGDWARACTMAGMRYLDPRQPTGVVIDTIAGADLVLTESLHGAIIADTYGVPWQAFATCRNFGTTKWLDWTASLGLEFAMTALPPPSAELPLRAGLRAEPYGTTTVLPLADALREFDARVGADRDRRLRRWARHFLIRAKPLQRVLGFTPERTAAALTRLAERVPLLSAETTRERLRDDLLGRLRKLEVAQRVG